MHQCDVFAFIISIHGYTVNASLVLPVQRSPQLLAIEFNEDLSMAPSRRRSTFTLTLAASSTATLFLLLLEPLRLELQRAAVLRDSPHDLLGSAIGQLKGFGAEPLGADNCDQRVWQDAADRRARRQLFEFGHFVGSQGCRRRPRFPEAGLVRGQYSHVCDRGVTHGPAAGFLTTSAQRHGNRIS